MIIIMFCHFVTLHTHETKCNNLWVPKYVTFQGGDLDKLIEEHKKTGRRFQEEQITEWIIQLLLALQYMHGR